MISSAQSLSCVQLFATPWTAALQASLSITNSWSLFKLMLLSWWCHSTISCSVVPFFSSFNLSQHQDLLQWVSSSHQGTKILEFQLQISPSNEYSGVISFRMNWLDLLAVQVTLKSLLQHHSSKASVLQCTAFFIVQLSHLYMTIGKMITLTRWTFVGKVMPLLFNMLSGLVISFLPSSKHLSISWLQSPTAVILKTPKIKSVTVSAVSPSICHEVMGPVAMIFIFWMLSFKPTFSLSSFTFIKSLFSSSLLYAIRVVSSVYLWLLIFLPAILIPACASSSPAFLMMYSAYNLNKQSDNIQPWCTPFLIWNHSAVPCPVITIASWTAYRFLRRQVVCYSYLFKNFPQFVLIHTVKGFGTVNKAEVDVFLQFPCFLDDPKMLAIWSPVPLPFLNSAWTSGISQFTYCWSLAWRILSISLLVCEMSAIVW